LKLRIASLTILCLALAAIPAWANYDNGPINGTTDAWTINFGYIVSDTFVATGNMTGFSFGTWQVPGDTLVSVQWSVTSAENGGNILGSGVASGSNLTDKFISKNQYNYNVDLITVTGAATLTSGSSYWLNLQNATVASGDYVYWDENSGANCGGTGGGAGCPSKASHSTLGTIPSEAFTVTMGGTTGTTPEPSSIMLFGSGILGLAGVLRRKLF